MIFYRFLLNTQALGYLFVLEMLLAAHAINLLASAGSILRYTVL